MQLISMFSPLFFLTTLILAAPTPDGFHAFKVTLDFDAALDNPNAIVSDLLSTKCLSIVAPNTTLVSKLGDLYPNQVLAYLPPLGPLCDSTNCWGVLPDNNPSRVGILKAVGFSRGYKMTTGKALYDYLGEGQDPSVPIQATVFELDPSACDNPAQPFPTFTDPAGEVVTGVPSPTVTFVSGIVTSNPSP